MNVLFLDDSEERRKKFRRFCPSAVFATTALGCIEQLRQSSWDIVLLDHDLGDETFVDSNREDCGMEVVRWIATNKPNVRVIVCHSLNFDARKSMVSTLRALEIYEVLDLPIISLYSSPFIRTFDE